jgi:hypothetical protein
MVSSKQEVLPLATLDLIAALIFDQQQPTMKSGKYFPPVPRRNGSSATGVLA